MRGENWEEIQENRKWEIETAGHFSVIVGPYLWEQLNNDDDYIDKIQEQRLVKSTWEWKSVTGRRHGTLKSRWEDVLNDLK